MSDNLRAAIVAGAIGSVVKLFFSPVAVFRPLMSSAFIMLFLVALGIEGKSQKNSFLFHKDLEVK